MNKFETAQLLTVASGFDRFVRADELTTTAWQMVLKRVPYKLAEAAVLAHYSGPDATRQLMPFHVLSAVEKEARLSKALIEEDVRSAKARGLVAQSWPADELLDEDVRERLFALRHDASKWAELEA